MQALSGYRLNQQMIGVSCTAEGPFSTLDNNGAYIDNL
jgi:hypothetical protein